MSIQFACPTCKKVHNAPAEFAGRHARCTCGAVLVVPAPRSAELPAAPRRPPAIAPVTPSAHPLPPSAAAGAEVDPDAWSFPIPSYAPALYESAPRRSPYFWAVLGGVGLAAAIALGVLVWLLFPRGSISEADRYLPDGCVFVMTTNIDRFKSGPVYQEMKKDTPNFDAGSTVFEENFGISHENISRFTVGFSGKTGSKGEVDTVMVARLSKPIAVADMKAGIKRDRDKLKVDLRYEKVTVGDFTVYEENYRLLTDRSLKDHQGEAFFLPESTLLVSSPRLASLRKVLERGKSAEFSEGMQNALRAADFSQNMALAVDFQGLLGSGEISRGVGLSKQVVPGLDSSFLSNLLGFAANFDLDSSHMTCNATLLCKDAKVAEDAKKLLEGGQVVLRSSLKGQPGVAPEVPEMIDSIKFVISGSSVKCSLQTDVEPLLKAIKEKATKK